MSDFRLMNVQTPFGRESSRELQGLRRYSENIDYLELNTVADSSFFTILCPLNRSYLVSIFDAPAYNREISPRTWWIIDFVYTTSLQTCL